MSHGDIVPIGGQISVGTSAGVPMLFADAGGKTWRRVIEFFARIRNPNIREAQARSVARFADWCGNHKLMLEQLSPFLISAYVEELGRTHSPPSVKQHLAAVRMLLDYLVTSGILPINPAAAVRGPKYVVKRGYLPTTTQTSTSTRTLRLPESVRIATLPSSGPSTAVGYSPIAASAVAKFSRWSNAAPAPQVYPT